MDVPVIACRGLMRGLGACAISGHPTRSWPVPGSSRALDRVGRELTKSRLCATTRYGGVPVIGGTVPSPSAASSCLVGRARPVRNVTGIAGWPMTDRRTGVCTVVREEWS